MIWYNYMVDMNWRTMNVIEVKNVTKKYNLYKNEKEILKEVVFGGNRHKEHLALKNVSFKVKKGETFGVLGGNGSGKSTVLNIINGTTQPTSGKAITRGKVSLLNVGAGIIAGYTGYENIYYKCGLMGLTRKQVDERLESIIEFSELGEFIEQPVKKYSSGMKAKLGFAIAIHVEPDILIVDEALAVGDARFQTKCHQKIRDLQASGVTILYVSHSEGAVNSICDRACWIQKGELICQGEAKVVSGLYRQFMRKEKTIEQITSEIKAGKHEVS